MKKNIHLILGILGLGLVGYSLVAAWNGFVPQFGSMPPVEKAGSTLWQGLAAGGLAVVAIALIFMRNRLSVVPGVLVIGMALYVYFAPEKPNYEPMIGIYLAIAGGVLLSLGGLLAGGKK